MFVFSVCLQIVPPFYMTGLQGPTLLPFRADCEVCLSHLGTEGWKSPFKGNRKLSFGQLKK